LEHYEAAAVRRGVRAGPVSRKKKWGKGELSGKLLPHVRRLLSAKKRGDKKAVREAEVAINRIAGAKVIPRGFTRSEKMNPGKLARVISCVSQIKMGDGGGVNPFAVCRDSVKAPGVEVDEIDELFVNLESFVDQYESVEETEMVDKEHEEQIEEEATEEVDTEEFSAPKRAKDFGDDPKIRRKYGEASKFSKREPWEVNYRWNKHFKPKGKPMKLMSPKRARDFGDDPKIRKKSDSKRKSKNEPWEVNYRYKKSKKSKKKAPEEELAAPKRARDFGDNPKIRKKHDSKRKSKSEPWEVRYRYEKRRAPGVPSRDTVVTVVGFLALVAVGLGLKSGKFN